MTDQRTKFVNDLGLAAYILMHGFTVIPKKDKAIFFDCEDDAAVKEFDRLVLEYQPPNDFYTFDSCLMYLKKLNDHPPGRLDDSIHKEVSDLGVAAYILMHEYKPRSIGAKVIGKSGRYIFFEHPAEKSDDLDRLCYQYLPSQFQSYDSNLMALKKIVDYMPRRQRS